MNQKKTLTGVGLATAAGGIGLGFMGIKWLNDNAKTLELKFEEGKPYSNSKYYSQGDYVIHYRIDESKRDTCVGKIFMIHGFACHSAFYDEMVEILTEQGYTCLRVDAPDCGYSSRESASVQHIDREDLFFGVMNLVDPTAKWILMGHSMGGGISMNMAYDHPEKFKCLCMYAPMVVFDAPTILKKMVLTPPMVSMVSGFFKYGMSMKPIMKLVILMMTEDIAYTRDFDVEVFMNGLCAENSGEGICYMTADARPNSFDNMGNIKVPTLLVWGDSDLFNAKGTVAKFQNALMPSDPDIHIIHNGGHCLVQNLADEVVDITMDFLDNNGIK